MTTQTHFFGTRTLARNFLNESTAESAKLKDFGKDAPTGERWAVLVEVAERPAEDLHASMDDAIARQRASMFVTPEELDAIAKQPSGIIGEQHLKTPNGKTCVVSWRRSMTPVRLARHLLKAS